MLLSNRFALLLFATLFLCACGNENSTPSATSTTEQQTTDMTATTIDWQGHRGARGLVPENTIPAFLKALEYAKVRTLELDLAISKDEQVIISHEPWMSHHICSHPDGRPVEESEEEKLLLFQMSYEEIKQYDCGSRGNARFPDQKPMAVHKPSLRDMVTTIEQHCKDNNLPLPYYNMEIKSQESYDGIKTPGVPRFVELVLAEVNELGIYDRTNLQSFDMRVVREVQKQDSKMIQALLIENMNSVASNIEALGFTPQIYSPYYQVLTDSVVKDIHQRGMKVIPWTVNDKASMQMLIDIGVDGIITDYPNLIEEL
ncbi:MAG: glycerophosphodiester phosphodiesterase family protein [Bacteroidota bacterium]